MHMVNTLDALCSVISVSNLAAPYVYACVCWLLSQSAKSWCWCASQRMLNYAQHTAFARCLQKQAATCHLKSPSCWLRCWNHSLKHEQGIGGASECGWMVSTHRLGSATGVKVPRGHVASWNLDALHLKPFKRRFSTWKSGVLRGSGWRRWCNQQSCAQRNGMWVTQDTPLISHNVG